MIQHELFNLDSIQVNKRFKNKLIFNLDAIKTSFIVCQKKGVSLFVLKGVFYSFMIYQELILFLKKDKLDILIYSSLVINVLLN